MFGCRGSLSAELGGFLGAGDCQDRLNQAPAVLHVDRGDRRGAGPAAGLLERISGAVGAAAGDEDAPLPTRVTTLRPPLLAALLAEHTNVHRTRVKSTGKGSAKTEDFYDEEITPSAAVLAAVLARRS